MFEFLKVPIRFFDQNEVSYLLSGSEAMSIYTLPRSTRDLDFVVHLKRHKGIWCGVVHGLELHLALDR